MPDICNVKRDIYIRNSRPGVAPWIGVEYFGGGLLRREHLQDFTTSDWGRNIRRRVSPDNGRTWSAWDLLHPQWPTQGNCHREESSICNLADPASGKTIETVFQRIMLGDPQQGITEAWKGNQRYFDHGFYRLYAEDGKKGPDFRQFRYEEGAPFDEHEWARPDYLRTNQMYIGYTIIRLSDGSLLYPVCLGMPYKDVEDDRIVGHIPNFGMKDTVCGVRCFIGRWNAGRDDYDWVISAPTFLPRRISTRGLAEPAIAELRNSRLLLDFRGSNWRLDPHTVPGRHWMSVSNDKGRTWSPVTDWRFDTGEQFYSPASYAKMIRSTKTGKLYWVGNISDTPAKGNSPRYPLVIVEIDEELPALKKDTLTVIDQRNPARDAESLQLSNFSLIENRETRQLEIYLARIGEKGPKSPDVWTTDAWRYILTF